LKDAYERGKAEMEKDKMIFDTHQQSTTSLPVEPTPVKPSPTPGPISVPPISRSVVLPHGETRAKSQRTSIQPSRLSSSERQRENTQGSFFTRRSVLITAAILSAGGLVGLSSLATYDKEPLLDREKEKLLRIAREAIKTSPSDFAGEIAGLIGDTDIAKEGIVYCQRQNDHSYSGHIAALIGDTATVQKEIASCQAQGRYEDVSILSALNGDMERARQAFGYCQHANGQYYYMDTIPVLIGDTAAISQKIEKYRKSSLSEDALKLGYVAALAGNKEIVQGLIPKFDKWGWEDHAGELAATIGDAETAQREIKRCQERGLYLQAGLIAALLIHAREDPTKRMLSFASFHY
jgi:hypothetical protein